MNKTIQREAAEVFSSVAVIGAGIMGRGIAQAALASGFPVLLFDINEEILTQAKQSILFGLAKFAEKGKITVTQQKQFASLLKTSLRLEDAARYPLIIEAVAEQKKLKQDIFQRLEKLVPASTILASNTSSLSLSSMATALRYPKRFVGMHFFNPAALMRLVEVVIPVTCSQDTAARVFATAKAWGKHPIYVESRPGFVANRAARPFYSESLTMHAEKVATFVEIDEVACAMGGFKMGPFQLMDFIGHDVNFKVSENIFYSYYGDDSYMPSLTQQEMYDAGFLGRKAQRGFYSYTKGEKPKPALPCVSNSLHSLNNPEYLNQQNMGNMPALQITLFGQPEQLSYGKELVGIFEEKGLLRIHQHTDALSVTENEKKITEAQNSEIPQAYFRLDLEDSRGIKHVAYILPSRGKLALDEARQFKAPVILFDYAQCYKTSNLLCFSVSEDYSDLQDDSEASSYTTEKKRARIAKKKAKETFLALSMAGLCESLGKRMVLASDRPALIMLRLMSMLANQAVHLADKGGVSAEDIDAAVTLGLNYPVGLLQWIDDFGAMKLFSLLSSMFEYYPAWRYKPALLLAMKAKRGEFFIGNKTSKTSKKSKKSKI